MAPQDAHGPADMLAPHEEQNLPLASAPQFGHFRTVSFREAGTAMHESYTAVRLTSVDAPRADGSPARANPGRLLRMPAAGLGDIPHGFAGAIRVARLQQHVGL